MAGVKIAACIFDARGILKATNADHLFMLGRDQHQVLEHSFLEWTLESKAEETQRTFSRCLDGEPAQFVGHIVRPDGSVLLGRSQLFATHGQSDTQVLGTMQLLHLVDQRVTPAALQISEYVSDLTAELAKMSVFCGLDRLGENLNRIASEAGQVFEILKATLPPPLH